MTQTLASLIDDLADDLNESIYTSVFIASDAAIEMSPVDTSRFKNAWRVGIDSFTVDSSSNIYDMSGGSAQNIIANEVDNFDIMSNESLTIYNNVLDAETNTNYAATVSYDFTGGKALDILSTTEQLMYSSMD